MSARSLDEIAEELVELLPDDDRIELADRLIASVQMPDEVKAAVVEEVYRRYEDIVAGRVELIDHEDVMAEVRARFK